MANSKAPKHDFAPAWLKIPSSSDGLKGSGSKAGDHGDKGRPRRDDFHGGFNRYGPGDYMYGPLPRQRSFDAYYEDRRYSPQKFRHHSGDDDHFNGPPPYGYNYGYYDHPYRSQPALFRDGKYQHPNSRFGGQMNGAFPPGPPPPPPPPPYYDPYFYDYYPNDPYYPNYMRNLGNGGGPRKRYSSGDKDAKPASRHDKDKDNKGSEGDADNKKSENLDEEFPSLNRDAESSDSKPVKPSSGVWDGQSKDGSKRQQTSNIYKNLVPSKPLLRKGKDSAKMNGKDMNCNHAGTKIAPSSPYKLVNKESCKDISCQSPTQPIEIHNTRLVTTPKNLTDKKSDFLKALRQDNSSNTKNADLNEKDSSSSKNSDKKSATKEDVYMNGADVCPQLSMVNGINDLNITPIESSLSSSLEAEQRLLREMGWNEADDEEYVITEDEKREFEKLSKQLKEQRNGFKKTLPMAWSPHHFTTTTPPVTGDDSISSLSDNSDLE